MQGVVAFLPSFQYCEALCQHWQGTGIWQALAAKKRVFREPRSATEVEATLQAYSKCIADGSSAGPGGALMLCVVGGKMAEGINFGNGLGRCAGWHTTCAALPAEKEEVHGSTGQPPVELWLGFPARQFLWAGSGSLKEQGAEPASVSAMQVEGICAALA